MYSQRFLAYPVSHIAVYKGISHHMLTFSRSDYPAEIIIWLKQSISFFRNSCSTGHGVNCTKMLSVSRTLMSAISESLTSCFSTYSIHHNNKHLAISRGFSKRSHENDMKRRSFVSPGIEVTRTQRIKCTSACQAVL